MSAYKTIYILLLLAKYAICSCTRQNLIKNLNQDMILNCKHLSYDESETCKVVCTKDNQIIKLNDLNSNSITVYCKEKTWTIYSTYYYLISNYVDIKTYKDDFKCVDVADENFCSFKGIDETVLEIEEPYKGVTEDFYVTITCKTDEKISMEVYCSENKLYTKNNEEFDKAFYTNQCRNGCNKRELENLFSADYPIHHDCVKSNYNHGDSCSIYCSEVDNAFQTDQPTTVLNVVCEGLWKLKERENSLGILTETALKLYQCIKIQSGTKFCSLENVGENITKTNKNMIGLVEGQQTLISCVGKQKNPLKIYCNSDGSLYKSNSKSGVTKSFMQDYCEVPCKISELKKFEGEGSSLDCKNDVEYGVRCHAHCLQKETVFNTSNSPTKMSMICKGAWYIVPEEDTLESKDMDEVKDMFWCRNINSKEIYCEVEFMKPFVDFSSVYKGLSYSQKMNVSCKNSSVEYLTVYCDDDFKIYAEKNKRQFNMQYINEYCKGVCETSLLEDTVLDLRPEIEFLAESQKLVLGCLHNKVITPMKVYCKSDSYFYEDASDNKVTPEYAEQHCKGTCDVEKINSVVSYFEHKTGRAEENQEFDIPCRNGSSDSISGGASVPTNMRVYCYGDGKFYGVESDYIFTQSNFFDYCKVKCRKSSLLAYMDQNVYTDCGEETDYNKECFVYCKNGESLISSGVNSKHERKLVCKGLWNLETTSNTFVQLDNVEARNIQCIDYPDTPTCSLGAIDKQIVVLERDLTAIAELQTIKATCVTRSDIKFDILCSENNILRFADNDIEINKTKILIKCRTGCSLGRLYDLAGAKKFLPLTRNCFPSNARGVFEKDTCVLKCNYLNDWRYHSMHEIYPKVIYCKDDRFQYRQADGRFKVLETDDGVFVCEGYRQATCSIKDLDQNVVFDKTADEYREECRKGIHVNAWGDCVL